MNKLIAIALILSVSAVSIRATPVLGADVTCGTAAVVGGAAANCNGCGKDTNTSNLFAYDATNAGQNCQFSDCSVAITAPAVLNGWICNSCNGKTGSVIPAGQYFNGSTCSATCTGATAANGFVCSSSSSVLVFALLVSLLALLF
ncbi:hypothetical protein ABPG73_000594 [Tetrahymena malaccensis]